MAVQDPYAVTQVPQPPSQRVPVYSNTPSGQGIGRSQQPMSRGDNQFALDWYFQNLEAIVSAIGDAQARRLERAIRSAPDGNVALQIITPWAEPLANGDPISASTAAWGLRELDRFAPALTPEEGGGSPVPVLAPPPPPPPPPPPAPTLPRFPVQPTNVGNARFGSRNSFGQAVDQAITDNNVTFKNQYGLDYALPPTPEDFEDSYSGYLNSLGNAPFGMRQFAANQRGNIRSAIDRYNADNRTNVRAADALGSLNMKDMWDLADPFEAGRRNTFYRTRKV